MEVNEGKKRKEHALTPGTLIHEQYKIEEVLGEGGFGITYEAVHIERNIKVAVKEYFPVDYAIRENAVTEQKLHIFRGEEERYEKGKQRFLKEANILRDFYYLDGMVSVLDCFEANETAYIVMEYIDGITLKQYVTDNGCLTYAELITLLEPVMKALMKLHKQGVIHRDISPDNLMIGMDNKVRLIDFGAAHTGKKNSKTATVILKSGYAPPEQYLTEEKQGSWMDVYALAATMYMALTGHTPVNAVARLQGKELPPVHTMLKDIEPWQSRAIEMAMEIKVSKRFKNVEEFWEALTIIPTGEDEVTIQRHTNSPNIKNVIKGATRVNIRRTILFATGGVLLCFGLFLAGNSMGLFSVFQSARQQPKNSHLQSDTSVSANPVSSERSVSTTEHLQEQTLCKMPDVTGLPEQEAKEQITDSDNRIQITTQKEYSDTVKKGRVVRQSVEPDTQYNSGAIREMVLTVSKGRKKVTEYDKTTQKITTAVSRQTTSAKSAAVSKSAPAKSTKASNRQTNSSEKTAAEKTAAEKSDKPVSKKKNDIQVIESEEKYDEFKLDE